MIETGSKYACTLSKNKKFSCYRKRELSTERLTIVSLFHDFLKWKRNSFFSKCVAMRVITQYNDFAMTNFIYKKHMIV